MNKVLCLIVLAFATLYVVVQCQWNGGYNGYSAYPPQYGGGQQPGSNRLVNYALARAYYDNKVENRGIFRGGSIVATVGGLLFLWFAFNGSGGITG